MSSNVNLAIGVGRRKTAVARVYLRNGSGKVRVNGKDIQEYFPVKEHVAMVMQPLQVVDAMNKFDLVVTIRGGGVSGQAGACRHGLARALVLHDESNHATIKANGFLTRDSRMVERKKYGQRGARRKFQFSKR
ncbi:30S ribosomal protein S9 [Entomospira culicis]|uniref:Small ribosomal subunit protein uS9 n=1 Tax=Entomospira culicis TaxID=2719989 RepID=A0A968GHD5_9SPIO|nr:30S ribosomal protein S9 [Entomospira culicis]NIZ18454.1 30S ribosomal protein S9 [Entomospira culicis]NIZ68670.1 30S ribosomal protein S9 [Entomospira culicis]WDI37269.1 30S ribosomal protein S9 [Entomospira culicis]WDI38898.1 30S ribosomal protein S9 [Entomospira culicis]